MIDSRVIFQLLFPLSVRQLLVIGLVFFLFYASNPPLCPLVNIIIYSAIKQVLLSKATYSCLQTFYLLVVLGIEPTTLSPHLLCFLFNFPPLHPYYWC